MLKIGNADRQELSGLAARLGQGNADPGKELRSKGTDLYVKESAAFFTRARSREAHQTSAVAVVRGSLAKQFGISDAAAGRIMADVFGGSPASIRVADVVRLDDLARSSGVGSGDGDGAVEAAFAAAMRGDVRDRQGDAAVSHGPSGDASASSDVHGIDDAAGTDATDLSASAPVEGDAASAAELEPDPSVATSLSEHLDKLFGVRGPTAREMAANVFEGARRETVQGPVQETARSAGPAPAADAAAGHAPAVAKSPADAACAEAAPRIEARAAGAGDVGALRDAAAGSAATALALRAHAGALTDLGVPADRLGPVARDVLRLVPRVGQQACIAAATEEAVATYGDTLSDLDVPSVRLDSIALDVQRRVAGGAMADAACVAAMGADAAKTEEAVAEHGDALRAFGLPGDEIDDAALNVAWRVGGGMGLEEARRAVAVEVATDAHGAALLGLGVLPDGLDAAALDAQGRVADGADPGAARDAAAAEWKRDNAVAVDADEKFGAAALATHGTSLAALGVPDEGIAEGARAVASSFTGLEGDTVTDGMVEDDRVAVALNALNAEHGAGLKGQGVPAYVIQTALEFRPSHYDVVLSSTREQTGEGVTITETHSYPNMSETPGSTSSPTTSILRDFGKQIAGRSKILDEADLRRLYDVHADNIKSEIKNAMRLYEREMNQTGILPTDMEEAAYYIHARLPRDVDGRDSSRPDHVQQLLGEFVQISADRAHAGALAAEFGVPPDALSRAALMVANRVAGRSGDAKPGEAGGRRAAVPAAEARAAVALDLALDAHGTELKTLGVPSHLLSAAALDAQRRGGLAEDIGAARGNAAAVALVREHAVALSALGVPADALAAAARAIQDRTPSAPGVSVTEQDLRRARMDAVDPASIDWSGPGRAGNTKRKDDLIAVAVALKAHEHALVMENLPPGVAAATAPDVQRLIEAGVALDRAREAVVASAALGIHKGALTRLGVPASELSEAARSVQDQVGRGSDVDSALEAEAIMAHRNALTALDVPFEALTEAACDAHDRLIDGNGTVSVDDARRTAADAARRTVAAAERRGAAGPDLDGYTGGNTVRTIGY